MKTRRILTKSSTGPIARPCKLAPVIKKVEEQAIYKAVVVVLILVVLVKIIFLFDMFFQAPPVYYSKDAERVVFIR